MKALSRRNAGRAARHTLALAVAGVTLGCAPAPDDGAIRILPLGDSITQGQKQRPSYRATLYTLLEADGCRVDMLGSQRTPEHGAGWDADHEGHWGWRSDQIVAELPRWLRGLRPDFALVHLGTNDVLQGVATRSIAANLRTAIEQLRAANPEVTVLLAQLIPARTEQSARLRALNAAIAALAEAQSTPRSRVLVVDQHSGYDPALNPDGLHPGAAGARLMAERWHAALAPLLAAHCRGGDPAATR